MRDVKVFLSGVCSAAAVVGIIGTAVSAVAATPKAIDILDKAERDKGCELDIPEKVRAAWSAYIPAAVIGLSSAACVIGASVLNNKARISAAGAYAAVSQAYEQYRLKNTQLNGRNAHQRVLDSIAAEKSNGEVIGAMDICGGSTLDFGDIDEEVLFWDSYSERYFTSTVSRVLQAEYHFNRNYVLRGSASINELYEFLGISGVEHGDDIGFTISTGLDWVDFDHHKAVLDDGLEAHVIDISFLPEPLEDQ